MGCDVTLYHILLLSPESATTYTQNRPNIQCGVNNSCCEVRPVMPGLLEVDPRQRWSLAEGHPDPTNGSGPATRISGSQRDRSRFWQGPWISPRSLVEVTWGTDYCKERFFRPLGGRLEVIQSGDQASTGPEVRKEQGQHSGSWVQLAWGAEGRGWGRAGAERI